MARYTEAVCRQCRREGQKLFLKGDRCYTQKCVIGGTANTFDDIRRLHEQGADYIGCGPFRYTMNRPVHYEGSVHDRAFDDVTDIESRMYAHADEIEDTCNHVTTAIQRYSLL